MISCAFAFLSPKKALAKAVKMPSKEQTFLLKFEPFHADVKAEMEKCDHVRYRAKTGFFVERFYGGSAGQIGSPQRIVPSGAATSNIFTTEQDHWMPLNPASMVEALTRFFKPGAHVSALSRHARMRLSFAGAGDKPAQRSP